LTVVFWVYAILKKLAASFFRAKVSKDLGMEQTVMNCDWSEIMLLVMKCDWLEKYSNGL
jgi:hypothetical protein